MMFALMALLFAGAMLVGCAAEGASGEGSSEEGEAAQLAENGSFAVDSVSDKAMEVQAIEEAPAETEEGASPSGSAAKPSASEARAALNISEDYRAEFSHGPKGAQHQKYIVLHDTEGDGDGASVVNYWDSNNRGVAAHFIVNKDGSIVQCVPMDEIAHHAGFGNTGHNAEYGVTDESRDDKVGTTSIGSWAADYGMNSYSVGIEIVHVGGSGDYPKAQLEALDALIAYIDAYYGFESTIIDHKMWREGNSDTSPEFANYLANYRDHRTHD